MVRGEEGKARRSVGSLNVKSSPGDMAISGVKETVRSPASSMTVTEPPKAPTGWEDVIGEDETEPDWAFVDRVRAGLLGWLPSVGIRIPSDSGIDMRTIVSGSDPSLEMRVTWLYGLESEAFAATTP